MSPPDRPGRGRAVSPGFSSPAEALVWVAGTVVMTSAFTGWYSTRDGGITFSVLAWHTGAIGKLVFAVGLAVVLLQVARRAGFELRPGGAGAVIALLGGGGTILVLVRVLDVPDRLEPAGHETGIWISLAGAVLLIAAGLLDGAEEV